MSRSWRELWRRPRLRLTGASELRGRKAADAAFWFSLAGVASDLGEASIIDLLAMVAVDELRRFGTRPSCRAKDVMHIAERLAAAGVTGEALRRLSAAVADCLEAKKYEGRNVSTSEAVVKLLREGRFDMHSDRPLLWLWRFSIRQKKQRSFLRVAARQYEMVIGSDIHDGDSAGTLQQQNDVSEKNIYDWGSIFDDPTLPLVVDIGSGMGVSLHGLASIDAVSNHLAGTADSTRTPIDLDWKKCNFAGADLSRLAIGFANGISKRSGLLGRLRFFVQPAEDFLEQVKMTYPGECALILIQFPTPFRLQRVGNEGCTENDSDKERIERDEANRGNAQLPKHPFLGFMVTKKLLRCAHDTLETSKGVLLLQSNCEDVAVMMRRLATDEACFSTVDAPNCVDSLEGAGGRLPQRTAEWIQMGGERAEGAGWSKTPFLPRRGATETEVACLLEGTPVHRCAFRCKKELPRDYSSQ